MQGNADLSQRLGRPQDPNLLNVHDTFVVAFPACRSYAKGFAYFGALYSFNECVIEKYRAKHDRYALAPYTLLWVLMHRQRSGI